MIADRNQRWHFRISFTLLECAVSALESSTFSRTTLSFNPGHRVISFTYRFPLTKDTTIPKLVVVIVIQNRDAEVAMQVSRAQLDVELPPGS